MSSPSAEDRAAFIRANLDDHELFEDSEGSYAQAIGLRVRPAAVVVRGGWLVEAAAVTTVTQLEQFVQDQFGETVVRDKGVISVEPMTSNASG